MPNGTTLLISDGEEEEDRDLQRQRQREDEDDWPPIEATAARKQQEETAAAARSGGAPPSLPLPASSRASVPSLLASTKAPPEPGKSAMDVAGEEAEAEEEAEEIGEAGVFGCCRWLPLARGGGGTGKGSAAAGAKAEAAGPNAAQRALGSVREKGGGRSLLSLLP